jgi:hypothetical protein
LAPYLKSYAFAIYHSQAVFYRPNLYYNIVNS